MFAAAKREGCDTLMVSYWLPVIRAELEIHRKNPSRALEMIEPTTPYELANPDPGQV